MDEVGIPGQDRRNTQPAGKWEKVSGAAYADVVADDEGGMPAGLGLEKLPTLSRLIQDNRDAMVFGGQA